jgi:trimethylamine:corrinoid methyltransferase-like protein
VPTTEAGAQKAIGALLTALALGEGFIEAGLLSIDEVCSPVQMILDYEIAKALSALLAEPTINDIECAFDEIAGLKAGEGFFGTEFSASRCRTEMFLPKTWSKQSLSGWLRTGCKVDTDYARDWIASFNTNYCAGSLLSDAEERELSTIISKAARGTTAVI